MIVGVLCWQDLTYGTRKVHRQVHKSHYWIEWLQMTVELYEWGRRNMKIHDKCWAFLLELEWWVVGGSAAAVVVASMVARRRCLNGKWYWWSCCWCWWSDGGVSGHDVVMTSQCPWLRAEQCGLVIIEMLDVWMHTSIWSWRPSSFWITYNIFRLFFNKNKNSKCERRGGVSTLK